MCRDAGWRLQEEIDREQAEQGAAPSQEETGEVSRRHTLVININTHLYIMIKLKVHGAQRYFKLWLALQSQGLATFNFMDYTTISQYLNCCNFQEKL